MKRGGNRKMTNEEPSVLILMTAYNGERFLRAQIDSILSQTYKNWMLFVQDDGSSDGTNVILAEYAAKDARICLYKNEGPHGAFLNFHSLINKARHEKSFDYYMFSDHDDVWLPGKIEFFVRQMEQYSLDMPVLLYADMCVIDENGKVTQDSLDAQLGLRLSGKWDRFYQHSVYGCNTCLNRVLFMSAPPVDVSNRAAAILSHDNYLAKYAALFGSIVFIPEVTMQYRRYGKNVTAANPMTITPGRVLSRIMAFDDLAKDHARTYLQTLYTLDALMPLLPVNERKIAEEVSKSIQKGGLSAFSVFLRRGIRCGKVIRTLSRGLVLLTGRYRKYMNPELFIKNVTSRQTKILALYLPQYHTFPENDAWWGKGFTEWTNVRKAKPLYKGHYQPEIPLNNDYYDLADYSVMKRQMENAKKYGIDGFCYYHYWFGGHLLMEKPLETMRDASGEKLPYCLCWANEPWTRAWDGKSGIVLMPQNYGGEKEWEKHFQYLLSFFRDRFYLKEDNAPVLVVYRCNNIPDCDAMAAYWNRRAREEGFSGIYLIEEVNTFQKEPVLSESKAYLEFEPVFTTNHRRSFVEKALDKTRTVLFNLVTRNHCIHVYKYDMVWRNIVRRKEVPMDGKQRCPGAFVRWDNTPRKGSNAIFYAGASPKAFEKFMRKQLEQSEKNGCRYIFLNAWNEWGEGAYMEPDSRYGWAFLNALKRAKKAFMNK